MGPPFFSVHSIKRIDFTLPFVCSAIDHRSRKDMVKTAGTHAARVPLLLFLP